MNKDQRHQYYTSTQGMCNQCGKLVPAKIFFQDSRVYMEKHCPDHGLTVALVFSDAQRYRALTHYTTAGKKPLKRNATPAKGCPHDCGLCDYHAQHTCLPIVEITDRCNLNCPICIAQNGGSWEMPPHEFAQVLDNLVACEGNLDVLNISGGEPTVHSQLAEILRLANRKEFAAVSINTNGLALTDNEGLLELLAANQVFVALQFDGFADEIYRKLRGRPLLEEKMKAMEKLKAYDIPTSLVVTAAKGINDDHLGEIESYFLNNNFIRSMIIQPLSIHRDLPMEMGFDPMDRLTIPDVVKLLAEGSQGVLTEDDILPLPCSHPACFHLAYLLDLGAGEYTPISRVFPVNQYLDVIRNRAFFGLDYESMDHVQALIYQLWSSAGSVPITKKILSSIKGLLKEVTHNYTPQKAMQLGSKKIKSLFIHHFMDRFNFDLSRANKCCQHYPVSANQLIPCCVHNNVKRVR